MIRLLAVLLCLAPLSAFAHADHSEGPTGIAALFHYIFSFDHYAGTIAVVVAGVGFIVYRNLRRKLTGKKGNSPAEC